MQLHLGLRVVNIFPTFFWDIASYKKHNPIIDWIARSMCLRERNRIHVAKAVAAPLLRWCSTPSGVRPCFPCTDPPSAQTRARALLSLSVTQVPITWQVGDFLSESEALYVSLLNFIFQTDYVKWLCPVAESPVPPSEVQPCVTLPMFFPLKLPPGLPVNRVTDYRIDVLPDYKPLAHWRYRMSPEEDKELNAQLEQYSADGYIEYARSAYAACTLSTMKRDGGLRPCFDCMALNQTITSFQELMNYCMASKAPRFLVK